MTINEDSAREVRAAVRRIRTDLDAIESALRIESAAPATSSNPSRTNLLFVGEVAERIGRSPDQLRYMITQGTAPKNAKIAGRIMFRESDIEAWLDAQFEGGE